MAITKDDALDYGIYEFHFNGNGGCWRSIGPKGGIKEQTMRVRRNGAVQLWKTRPSEWSMPVKYGVRARDQFRITQNDAHRYHKPCDCPLLQTEGEVPPTKMVP